MPKTKPNPAQPLNQDDTQAIEPCSSSTVGAAADTLEMQTNMDMPPPAPTVFLSETDANGKQIQRGLDVEGIRVIASYLTEQHDFCSLRRVNRAARDKIKDVWLEETFYLLCQAALTDGKDGKGYTNDKKSVDKDGKLYEDGNKGRVKKLLDIAAESKDKTLLRQLLTMELRDESLGVEKYGQLKEYGAHCPKGTLYGMLLKRGYVALNENDEGLAEIVATYYGKLEDGEALRQAEHEKAFPKSSEDDTRTLAERVAAHFAEQKPFDFMPIIKAIKAASDAEKEHQIANPRDTSTVLGKAMQQFRDEFDAVCRAEAIYNSQHYLQVIADADQSVQPDGLQDEVFSCQVLGYVQLGMPRNLLHAHAQGLHGIAVKNEKPKDSPLCSYKEDGHVVFGPDLGPEPCLGYEFFALPRPMPWGGLGVTWSAFLYADAAGDFFKQYNKAYQIYAVTGAIPAPAAAPLPSDVVCDVVNANAVRFWR